jgi:hypothetical protein
MLFYRFHARELEAKKRARKREEKKREKKRKRRAQKKKSANSRFFRHPQWKPGSEPKAAWQGEMQGS